MRIAYGGHPGAFGELACLGRFPDEKPIGFDCNQASYLLELRPCSRVRLR